MTIDPRALDRLRENPQTRDALDAVGLTSWAVLRSWYTAGPDEMRAFVGDGPMLTDDRPLVEYHHWLPRPEEQPPLDLSALKGTIVMRVIVRLTIDTVFLDAGGVLCHPSWTRVADALVRHGATVTSAALAAAEQKATCDIDKASVIGATDDRARGWLYFNLVLQHAGVAQKRGHRRGARRAARIPPPRQPVGARRARCGAGAGGAARTRA